MFSRLSFVSRCAVIFETKLDNILTVSDEHIFLIHGQFAHFVIFTHTHQTSKVLVHCHAKTFAVAVAFCNIVLGLHNPMW